MQVGAAGGCCLEVGLGTAGRKGLGLQRRVRVDLGGDQAMGPSQLKGAQSGRAGPCRGVQS